MTTCPFRAAAAVAALATAVGLTPPTPEGLAETVRQVARPLVLPFRWQAVSAAQQRGDAVEMFARAQDLLRLLPEWADGHSVFAYRFALAPTGAGDDGSRGAAARARLELALAYLHDARAKAGRREASLLLDMAFLPQVAAQQEPALQSLLAPAGGAAAIADRYLAEAERLFPSAARREQRTFHSVRLVAGLLEANDRAGARAVLSTAIERSHDVRDAALAAEWRARLDEVARWLGGDATVDLSLVQADPRFQPLLPWLR
ncbi:MAG: hypothetical protein WAT39_04605 [Planctomycetota bacterium]